MTNFFLHVQASILKEKELLWGMKFSLERTGKELRAHDRQILYEVGDNFYWMQRKAEMTFAHGWLLYNKNDKELFCIYCGRKSIGYSGGPGVFDPGSQPCECQIVTDEMSKEYSANERKKLMELKKKKNMDNFI